MGVYAMFRVYPKMCAYIAMMDTKEAIAAIREEHRVYAPDWVVNTQFERVHGEEKNVRIVIEFFSFHSEYLPRQGQLDLYALFRDYRQAMTEWISYLRHNSEKYRIPLVDEPLLDTLQRHLDAFCAGSMWMDLENGTFRYLEDEVIRDLRLVFSDWDNVLSSDVPWTTKLRYDTPLEKLYERLESMLDTRQLHEDLRDCLHYLQFKCNILRKKLCNIRQPYQVALAMGAHLRLGEDSPLAELDIGLLAHIASLVC
jgi:hypothetical protein